MLILKQSTAIDVRLGPFVDATDGVTPETGITIAGADQAEVLKADGAATVAMTGTLAAVTGADGWYDYTAATTDVDTVGEVVFVIQDASVCLPVFTRAYVVEEAVYDALYAASAAGPLQSTTAGRTLDVTATGAAGIDWGNVENQTTAVDLSGTDIQLADTTTTVTNQVTADMTAISGDSAAADNLELMYDGTGYTDDTGPASRAQVSGIGTGTGSALNFPVSADNTGGAIIDSVTFVGTQTGTFTNTESNLGTFHQIDHSGNAFDIVYRIACGAIRTAVSVMIDAYLNGSNDTANIQVYDHIGADWETIATLTGTNGSTTTQFAITLFEKHTGALGGSEAGNLYIRFVTSAQTAPALYVARVSASAVPATSTIGYENGQVWVDEANGSSTGTTLGVDGVFANQCDDFDNGQTIADALGTSFIHIHPGNSVTLTAALEGYVVRMVQVTLDGGSQDVGSTRFNEGTYVGTFTRTSGFPSFADGRIFGAAAVSFPQFVAFRCSVVGTLTLSEAANQSLIDCQAGGTATIDCGSLGSGFILNLVRWSGNVTFNNLASGAVVNLQGDGCGDVILNGADATVNIDGTVATVTNNLTGSPTVTDNSLSLATINAEADTAISDASLATAAALTTAQNDLDIITGADGVNLLSATQASIDAIETDTADMQPKLGTPAGADMSADIAAVKVDTAAILVDTGTDGVVVTGTPDVNVAQVSGDSTAADRLEAMMDGLVTAAVNDASATTTSFIADGFTEATDDHFIGRLITFTSGALLGQQTDITDYVGSTQTFTVTALTEAPADNDTFVIH